MNQEIKRIIRMPSGVLTSTGASGWHSVDHSGVLSGNPMERMHDYFQISAKDADFRVGIWESTAYIEQIVDYAYSGEVEHLFRRKMNTLQALNIG